MNTETLPKISLVTPSYNQAEFIEQTIRSVQEQEYPCLEHLIMDGESTDGTQEILARCRELPNVRVHIGKDTGQSNAINLGMRQVTGEVAGWLNSDDLLYPGALHAIGRAFAASPAAGVVYGRGAKVNRAGELIRLVPYRPFSRADLRTAYRVVQPAMFFKRRAFHEVGGVDESLEYAMDWELLIRLAEQHEIVSINEPIAKIRYYDETKTARGGWDRMKEIAGIGRRRNGLLDRNFLSYLVRTGTARFRSDFIRRVVDWGMAAAFRKTPYMVQGWP